MDCDGLVFRTSGKLADYHGDIISGLFEKLFRGVIPKTPT